MNATQSRSQVSYWNLLYDLNVYFNYLQIYQERDQAVIRCIGIFLAVSSSSSIAAWVIWREVSWLWASIIAVSQVLNVSSSFLPYKQREKTLRTVLPQMHTLLLDCEDRYDAVSKGELTDKQIHQEAMAFKRQLSTLKGQLYSCGLPQRNSYLENAEKRAKQELKEYTNTI
jgi:hypothetical protein